MEPQTVPTTGSSPPNTRIQSWLKACVEDDGKTTIPSDQLDAFLALRQLEGAQDGLRNYQNGKGLKSTVSVPNPEGDPPRLTFVIYTTEPIPVQ